MGSGHFRLLAKELYGKVHTHKFTFGGTRDNVYAGSFFTGSDGPSVAWLMSNGDSEGELRFTVAGATELTLVDWQGRTSTLNASEGVVTVPVSDLASYLRVPSGAIIALVDEAWGPNLARAATASVRRARSLPPS